MVGGLLLPMIRGAPGLYDGAEAGVVIAAHRLVERLAEQLIERQHCEPLAVTSTVLLVARNGLGDEHLGAERLEPFLSRTRKGQWIATLVPRRREDTVSCRDICLANTLLLADGDRCLKRLGSVDEIIDVDRILAIDLAFTGEVGDLRLVGARTSLAKVVDLHGSIDHISETSRTGQTAIVGRDDNEATIVARIPLAKVASEDEGTRQVVGRPREEALLLIGVEVHRHDVLDAVTQLEHVGHVACRDRLASFGLAILPHVRQIGQDEENAVDRGAVERLNGQVESHELLVGVRMQLPEEVDLLTTHSHRDHRLALAVGEGDVVDGRRTNRFADLTETLLDTMHERGHTLGAQNKPGCTDHLYHLFPCCSLRFSNSRTEPWPQVLHQR